LLVASPPAAVRILNGREHFEYAITEDTRFIRNPVVHHGKKVFARGAVAVNAMAFLGEYLVGVAVRYTSYMFESLYGTVIFFGFESVITRPRN
jgi:hypothetical protein